MRAGGEVFHRNKKFRGKQNMSFVDDKGKEATMLMVLFFIELIITILR